jgi:uncharacterized protein YjbJ (UPF0337 family)
MNEHVTNREPNSRAHLPTTKSQPVAYEGAPLRRVSWGAIFAGALIALVTQLAFTLLGIGIGAGAVRVDASNPGEALKIGTIIWTIASILISLFTGGYVAGRLSGSPRRHDGMLNGLVSFALVALASLYLLTTALGWVVGGVTNVLGSTLSLAGQGIAAAAPEVFDAAKQRLSEQGVDLSNLQGEADKLLRQTGKPELQPENLERQAQGAASQAQGAAQNAARNPNAANETGSDLINKLFGQSKGTLSAVDRDAAINVIVARTGKSRDEAGQIVDNWQNSFKQAQAKIQETTDQAKEKAREAAQASAQAASRGGLVGSLALVLGAAAAALGGRLGTAGNVLHEYAGPNPPRERD